MSWECKDLFEFVCLKCLSQSEVESGTHTLHSRLSCPLATYTCSNCTVECVSTFFLCKLSGRQNIAIKKLIHSSNGFPYLEGDLVRRCYCVWPECKSPVKAHWHLNQDWQQELWAVVPSEMVNSLISPCCVILKMVRIDCMCREVLQLEDDHCDQNDTIIEIRLLCRNANLGVWDSGDKAGLAHCNRVCENGRARIGPSYAHRTQKVRKVS